MKLETKLKSNDLFGSLQPENEQELDRKPEIKTNPNLEYLTKEYEMFIKDATSYGKTEELYKKIRFDKKNLTSKNIEEFSVALEKHQKLKNFSISGYFLSRVINDSSDKEFVLHTNYLDSLIRNIGHKNNGKTITVNGNAGNFVGYEMKNGNIIINGNAGDWSGSFMENGSININGDAGYGVGSRMHNGIIHLNGDYKSLSPNIKGGNIYHKGKLIVEKGRKVE